ncbi:MAG: AraC family transcriptional regulator [Pyrinomonadaceae bacterium]
MKTPLRQLFGQTVKSNWLADFRFTETVYSESVRLPFHSHGFAYFCFVLDGSFTERVEKNEHLCQSSTVVFHTAGERHSDYFHTPSRCFNIQPDPQFFERFNENKRGLKQAVIQKNAELNRLTMRLYREFYEADEFSSLSVEGLMFEIVAGFLRHSNGRTDRSIPKWLLTARDLISEEFADNLTISSIAATVGVHPTHLAREFRRYFQMTIGDFIRHRRVESACQKIVNSRAPLSQISAECGFYDQSHFTRIFRKAMQMTPAVYRALYQDR